MHVVVQDTSALELFLISGFCAAWVFIVAGVLATWIYLVRRLRQSHARRSNHAHYIPRH